MDLIVQWTIVLAYVTLALELTLFHVPSIASFRSMWIADDDVVACYSTGFQRLFRLGRPAKLLLFIPPLVVVYCVFLYPIVAVVWNTPALLLYSPDAVTQVVSLALVVSGRMLGLLAVRTMLKKPAGTQEAGLLRSGPFRYSRNPGLTGMFVMFAGFWLVLPSYPFLLGIVIYILYMHFKVRMEEDYLLCRFGSEFDDYMQSTRRYI